MHIRRLGALALLLGLAFVGITPSSAHAATGVTINKISVAPVAAGTKATIKPKVSTVGELKIVKKYFSIWNSAGRRIVNKKTSAKLAAGTYKVKTVVTFKAERRSGGYYPAKTVTRTQRLTIATSTATCATATDAARVRPGDTKSEVAGKLHSAGQIDWSETRDDVVHEHWRYTLCGSDVQWVWVSYDNGLVTDTWVE